MKSSGNVIRLKPTTKLKLTLLPPKEEKAVTPEDVKYFYKKLATLLLSEL